MNKMKTTYYSGIPISNKRGFLWALFGNELDGVIGDAKWNPERKDTLWIRIKWWCRNPFHNLTWHVIGFAHLPSIRYDVNNEDVPGMNKAWSIKKDDPSQKKYPYWLYIGKGWEGYFGWRGRGNFGIKLRRVSQ